MTPTEQPIAQRFLITGGTQGIGAALVRAARLAGHQVLFTGRDKTSLHALADATGAHPLRADVSQPADNEATVKAAESLMGGVDVLVNNAGFGYMAPIGSVEMAKLRSVFDTNVFGLIDLTNRIVPGMIARGSGDIINVASTSGMKGHEQGTAYSSSKWAVRGLTQCWQAELRPHGIRAICVCPSEVQTGFGGRTGRNNPNKLFAEDLAGVILAALAQPRRVMLPEFAVWATNPWAK